MARSVLVSLIGRLLLGYDLVFGQRRRNRMSAPNSRSLIKARMKSSRLGLIFAISVLFLAATTASAQNVPICTVSFDELVTGAAGPPVGITLHLSCAGNFTTGGTVVFNWNDGSPNDTLNVPPSTGPGVVVSPTHNYAITVPTTVNPTYTLTDSAGVVLGIQLNLNLAATSATGVSLILVTVEPAGAALALNGNFTFNAFVTPSSTNQAVNWSVNSVAGGNATVGTITGSGTSSGVYTAPATVPAGNVIVTAVPLANAASSFSVLVRFLPSITTQPANQAVAVGQAATFSVVATGTPPLTFQWNRNGTPIAGATGSSFTTPPVTPADNGSTFTVTVSNAVGNVTSNPATLSVLSVGPTITTQPANQTVPVGQAATFSVVAAGTPPLSFQWSKNGTPIVGATGSSFTTAPVTTADNGSTFTVTVSNSGGSVTSNPATLTVTSVGPAITTQPANQTVAVGQKATFSVTATGTAPLSFQWSRNGTPITGATGSSFTTAPVTAADNGATFTVTVSNSAGTVTSNPATLTVRAAAPVITTQPANQTVAVGQTATFSVAATGTAPLSFQWSRNGTPIVGATGSSFTTAPVTTADNGATFTVTVSNSAGSVTSNPATLSVTSVGPAITTQPANQTVAIGQTATFSVTATGTAPLSFQWSRNGTPIVGATGSSFTTAPVTAADNGATFTVTISNSAGSVTSNPATLTVTSVGPTITTQPANQTVAVGQTATFSVTATGTAPLSFQWSRNGKPIAGATGSSFTTAPVTTADNGATFTVTVSNSAGTVTSNPATLTVSTAAPVITTQPANQTVVAGQTATFSVTATGTAPLSFQWSQNGKPIAGATASSFTTPPVTTAENGSVFTVVVSNSAGSVTSNTATLTVTPAAPVITIQPVNQTVVAGQTSSFSVTATGTAPLNFQWSQNGKAIAGATANTFTTPPVTIAESGSTFTVTVSNSAGSVTSNPATLTVTPAAPVITIQPANQTVAAGGTATFSVTATGTAPLSFQWSQDGKAIARATSSTFTTGPLTSADNGSIFTVVVRNSAGSVTSNPATLTVTPVATPTVSFTGPSNSSPAEAQSLQLSLSQYSQRLNPTLTLRFVPGSLVSVPGGVTVCDKSVSLNNQTSPTNVCDSPLTVALPPIPAGSTFSGTIPLSVGSLSGEFTVTLDLKTDSNLDVTPPTGNVIQIGVPPSPPVIKSAVLTRNGNILQIDIQGLCDTREVTSATFHFTAAVGSSLTTSDFTLPVLPQFTTWFQDPNSAGDGSGFSYSQQFSVQGDSANVTSVTVTLSNSVGTSNAVTAQ